MTRLQHSPGTASPAAVGLHQDEYQSGPVSERGSGTATATAMDTESRSASVDSSATTAAGTATAAMKA